MDRLAQQPKWLRTGVATLWWLSILAFAAAIAWSLLSLIPVDATPLTLSLRGETITLQQPRALWALAALPLVPALQWFTLSDFSWAQRLSSAFVRMTLIAALVVAVARPTQSEFDAEVCTTYLVDVSASVPDTMLEAARERVQASWNAAGSHRANLVTFAATPRAIPLAPGAAALPPFARHGGDDALNSDSSAALRLAYGLCPTDTIRRVVLVTDGNETRGDLVSEAATAADFGIALSAFEVPFVPVPEVMIRDVEFPDDIQLSEPFTAVIDIYSTESTSASLSITQNGFRDLRGRAVTLVPGINRVDVTLEVYDPGLRSFELVARADGDDHFAGNNRFLVSRYVAGRPRVLYVEGEGRSRSYLQRALDRNRNDLANFDLDVRTASGFPGSVEELGNFDMVILSDVDARYLSRRDQRNIEEYVRDLGGSFLMAGGERSFGPGGFDNTLLEEISPVSFDMQRQRNQPSLAIMLVIDRSGSMDGAKIEMAKDAAQAVVEILGPQDAIGVIAFDTQAQTVVRLQPATNRARIRSDIGRIAVGGGTDILPALTEAYVELASRPARLKHVIVLTDGAAPWDGIADLTSAMRSEGITVSAVAVGSDADRGLLEMIADLGGGRFHQTNDPNNIPQIFVQETSAVARTNLVEEPFRPVVTGRSQALRGIDWASVPYLLGYVQTTAKPRADVLLETEQGHPLLARWRLGLGRVAVFTSDVKNRWAVEWVRSHVYPQFWAQVIRDMMRLDSRDELAMQTSVEQGVALVRVDALDGDDRFISGLQSRIDVTTPSGETQPLTLRQVAAGRYEAELPLSEYGAYLLEAEHERDGREYAVSFGSLTWPYPDEFLAFEPDLRRVARAVDRTGGLWDPDDAALWDPGDELRERRRERWPWLLFAALGLLVVDVFLRRIRWFGSRATSWQSVLSRS
ncbi:MAG: Ca-activated chloride channel family protein [Bradymonadia bacterium]|jgi:Ca-activated chloride channel family protein